MLSKPPSTWGHKQTRRRMRMAADPKRQKLLAFAKTRQVQVVTWGHGPGKGKVATIEIEFPQDSKFTRGDVKPLVNSLRRALTDF